MNSIQTTPVAACQPSDEQAKNTLSGVWLVADLDTVEENLALDEALLEEAHEGLATRPVIRTWMARRPVVVVGSSSHIDQEVDRTACLALGVGIVRRHGVLYHGTLLDDFDISVVSRVLRHPPREPDYRGQRPHGEFLTTLKLGRESLEDAVRDAFQATEVRHEWPRDRVERLLRERYIATDWTERL